MLAKVAESLDGQLFAAGGLISGQLIEQIDGGTEKFEDVQGRDEPNGGRQKAGPIGIAQHGGGKANDDRGGQQPGGRIDQSACQPILNHGFGAEQRRALSRRAREAVFVLDRHDEEFEDESRWDA